MNQPQVNEEALAVLSEAWAWRELSGARCKELLHRAGTVPVSVAVLAAEVAAATLVVWGYLCFREARQAEALESAAEATRLLSDH